MLGDTILARASAPGASERAVLRLSGPAAIEAAAAVFAPAPPRRRATIDGTIRVRQGTLPALALVMPGPGSFTGEDTVELHVPGSPLLVQVLQDAIVAASSARGVRVALPGEFTARAFANGRLDAAQVEGILMLLHAADAAAAARAVQWLRGGLSAAVAAARARLQDALALLEAGLDFGDGETGEVPREQWLLPLAAGAGELDALHAALPAAAPGGEVLLLGAANAGKSSLCNALAGRDAVLVDAVPGTTRDLLRVEIAPGVAVWDAPGDLERPGAFDTAALALRDRLAGRAAAALCVLDASAAAPAVPETVLDGPLPLLAVVWTKTDRAQAPASLPASLAARAAAAGGVPVLATSAATGSGLGALRSLLVERGAAGVQDLGGPWRAALGAARDAVQRARERADLGAELVAVELQSALRALDAIDGRHSPEHLLDRIYGRFCLGK